MISMVVQASVALLIILGATPVWAGKQVALVMGNGAYVNASPLPNPPRDARAVARVLERLGFQVFSGIDLDNAGSRRLISQYMRALEGAATGLVYYAGHGIQVDGENYILPVDAALESRADLRFNTISLSALVEDTESSGRVNIYVLDACRNNPLSRSFQHQSRSTAGQGLARINAGTGTMFVYATAPDDVALDGEGNNSPFTAAFLQHLETPGLEINRMMTRVRADVYAMTREQQLPWTNSALLGEFYFVPGADAPPRQEPLRPNPVPIAPATDRRIEPNAFDMVLCTAKSGASWAGERILMFSQCSAIGGDWQALQ